MGPVLSSAEKEVAKKTGVMDVGGAFLCPTDSRMFLQEMPRNLNPAGSTEKLRVGVQNVVSLKKKKKLWRRKVDLSRLSGFFWLFVQLCCSDRKAHGSGLAGGSWCEDLQEVVACASSEGLGWASQWSNAGTGVQRAGVLPAPSRSQMSSKRPGQLPT